MSETVILDVHSEGRVVIQTTVQTPDEVLVNVIRTSKIARYAVKVKPIKDLQKLSQSQLFKLLAIAGHFGNGHFGAEFKLENFTLLGN